jgi:hypothetical protein
VLSIRFFKKKKKQQQQKKTWFWVSQVWSPWGSLAGGRPSG